MDASQPSAHRLAQFGAVNQLNLAPGETDAASDHLSLGDRITSQRHDLQGVSASTLNVFRDFERPLIPALRPGLSTVASIPAEEFASFANAVVEVRASRLRAAQEGEVPKTALRQMMQSLNAAVVAARNLQSQAATQPLGMLNLERIEMVPGGHPTRRTCGDHTTGSRRGDRRHAQGMVGHVQGIHHDRDRLAGADQRDRRDRQYRPVTVHDVAEPALHPVQHHRDSAGRHPDDQWIEHCRGNGAGCRLAIGNGQHQTR